MWHFLQTDDMGNICFDDLLWAPAFCISFECFLTNDVCRGYAFCSQGSWSAGASVCQRHRGRGRFPEMPWRKQELQREMCSPHLMNFINITNGIPYLSYKMQKGNKHTNKLVHILNWFDRFTKSFPQFKLLGYSAWSLSVTSVQTKQNHYVF